ncbi:hypothetical protein K504DRAFT_12103 [Pleomassaria siparia CBS 279.74]|uniref:Uncharacterized protein n=1 Tax=Pleomassaria siparia CBS 279.74 TaxID=1314801 RepID=A0A6G1KQF2_9PLEO|nr:hypothetical protein K504DRAFT_12103 [Pleomassaria siparia CBS 279.74]
MLKEMSGASQPVLGRRRRGGRRSFLIPSGGFPPREGLGIKIYASKVGVGGKSLGPHSRCHDEWRHQVMKMVIIAIIVIIIMITITVFVARRK